MRGTYNDKNISANKFLSLTLTNTVYKTNPENIEFIACLWSFSSSCLLLRMSEEKIKENFTRRKNLQDQVMSRP